MSKTQTLSSTETGKMKRKKIRQAPDSKMWRKNNIPLHFEILALELNFYWLIRNFT